MPVMRGSIMKTTPEDAVAGGAPIATSSSVPDANLILRWSPVKVPEPLFCMALCKLTPAKISR
jgi:hypothetical protein